MPELEQYWNILSTQKHHYKVTIFFTLCYKHTLLTTRVWSKAVQVATCSLRNQRSYLFVCSSDQCLRFCDFHNGRARLGLDTRITEALWDPYPSSAVPTQENLTRFFQNAALALSRGVRAQRTACIVRALPSAFPSALKYPRSVLPILYTWSVWPNPCRCANTSYPPCRGCAAFHFRYRSSMKMRQRECQHTAWISRETARGRNQI